MSDWDEPSDYSNDQASNSFSASDILNNVPKTDPNNNDQNNNNKNSNNLNSNQQRNQSYQQRSQFNEQRNESYQQRSQFNEQRNESNQQRNESNRQRNESNQQRNESNQQNHSNQNRNSQSNLNSGILDTNLNHLSKMMRTKIVENNQDIEVLRNDPKSPLYSVRSFEKLHIPELLLKGLYSMGFARPSKIQETVLPLLIADPPINLIAQSQSGTGKTAAFLIASLKRVDENLNYPQVLILSPTLELALQIADVARIMAKYTKIKVRNIVKGEVRPRNDVNEHVIVGTVGKLVDWIFRFKAFDPKKIKVFVLDEADVMIDTQGFREQSCKIQGSLCKEQCQLLLFSATYSEQVLDFASVIITEPVVLTLPREEETVENVKQYYVECKDEEDKYNALANIFGQVTIGQCIIFLHTKASAKFLKERLEKDGHKIALLTGELETEERLNVIKRFREGDERVLITTNLTSRGIDIEQVTLVCNYDLPYDVFKKEVDYETYLHRIGRCGRFGKPGVAVSLIDSKKRQQKEQIDKLCEHFVTTIKLLNTEDSNEFENWD